jgi:coproporphyrinogen III oxidase-like Fe-S oxidoreductase
MRERLLLGLRLDEPVGLEGVWDALDQEALARLASGGLVELVHGAADNGGYVTLTRRGRFLAGGVAAELMAFATA